ncbi:GPW/gp25 family protein [Cellulomonas humilata]|uniref:GPW/gp25 family protein n=1 Tax=Cellulomonas humilata TaxID=144055 RepID=A0A7Y6E013_9CELL|nr:GPW/gp25 family protein [Cellulomonas humilata]NUU19599.1 GPW/gp25 family protein [Cellulomonas humilata]
MTRLAFPFGPTALGRSSTVRYGDRSHVRQMLELLLLTSPGERVMRPELGSPVRQMVFGPGGDATAIALDAALEATVQQWLGHVLTLLDLTVTAIDDDAALEIVVTYEVSSDRTADETRVRLDLT